MILFSQFKQWQWLWRQRHKVERGLRRLRGSADVGQNRGCQVPAQQRKEKEEVSAMDPWTGWTVTLKLSISFVLFYFSMLCVLCSFFLFFKLFRACIHYLMVTSLDCQICFLFQLLQLSFGGLWQKNNYCY